MKSRNLTRCALCVGLMAVCAWLAVPVGDIAITMQTFGLFFALGVLGGGKGSVVCGVYLLLGAMGLPVFSGFQGGLGSLLGPSGGYLWGLLLASLLYWLLSRRLPSWLCMMPGLLVCYLCGTIWFLAVYAPGGFWPVVTRCVLPYLLPDAIKLALAYHLSHRIRKYMA